MKKTFLLLILFISIITKGHSQEPPPQDPDNPIIPQQPSIPPPRPGIPPYQPPAPIYMPPTPPGQPPINPSQPVTQPYIPQPTHPGEQQNPSSPSNNGQKPSTQQSASNDPNAVLRNELASENLVNGNNINLADRLIDFPKKYIDIYVDKFESNIDNLNINPNTVLSSTQTLKYLGRSLQFIQVGIIAKQVKNGDSQGAGESTLCLIFNAVPGKLKYIYGPICTLTMLSLDQYTKSTNEVDPMYKWRQTCKILP